MHVSVVMTVYNGAATVADAVRSIIQQSYSDWDMVIIDDASTDQTPAILADLAAEAPRIRVLRNPHNVGTPTSRNRGWRNARGALVASMDADDISEPDRLARQVTFLNEHPEVDVLGSDAWLIDPTGKLLGRTDRPQTHEVLAARMYRETPLINPTVVMRRHVLEESGGYDERLRWSEDCDLWLRLYRKYRFHNLPVPLLKYRVGSCVSLARMRYGAFVLLRAARREGLLFTGGWYALRWLSTLALDRIGLRKSWPRAVDTAMAGLSTSSHG